MDASEFRVYGKQLVDFMADYIENIRMRPVLPTVKPGYLHHLIPDHAPQTPEKWDDIMKDIERVIMPGVTHWSSPYFHAYFPTGNSFPAICGDMVSDILGVIGFTWASCPAATELEMVVTDWLGKMINLPEEFLFSSKGTGGGVIQSTASESTLVSLFAARCKTIAEIRETNENMSKYKVMEKLVMYASDQLHTNTNKIRLEKGVSQGDSISPKLFTACLENVFRGLNWTSKGIPINGDRLTNLRFADNVALFSESPQELQLMVEELRTASSKVGLEINLSKTKVMLNRNIEIQPIMTGNVALDQVDRYIYLGQLISIHRDWEPEVRRRVALGWQAFGRLNNVWSSKLPLCLKRKAHSSVEKASILGAVVATLGTTGCCAFDNLEEIGEVCAKYKIWLHVDAAYAGSAFICSEFQYLMKGVEVRLRHSNYVVNSNIVDPLYLKHEHQEVIPDYRFIRLAHEFESMLLKDDHFEIIGDVIVGLVCFRLKGSDELNKKLLQRVNDNGRIYIVPSQFKDTYFLRFAIGGVRS
ncbi:Aromatic-L-amino-acid decarboxylase [Nymphon striatum]|nr:Aromatic-L-amino-acid decarboxylase [Nymphon striatum]